jgi:hypothetical protein
MAKRANKTLEHIRLQFPLQDAESYIGAFMGRTPIKWGWIFLVGPLATFTMKQYQVIVTDKRVIIARLSLLGAPTTIEQFTYPEIRAILLKKGMLTYKIGFVFNNRRRLNLNANHKAARAMEGFLFDEQLGSFLQNAVA